MEIGNRMNGGTWKRTGQRAHVHKNAYWKFCNLDKAFIISHLTMMELPFAGMMIKMYLRLKIGSELHWPKAVSTVVLAVVNMWIMSTKS